MPLFEFACKTCDHRFEWLTRHSLDGHAATPECPSCHGTNLEKRQSVFAARTSAGASGATLHRADTAPIGSCGACGDPRGPGSCSMN